MTARCRFCSAPLRFGNLLADFCDPHPSMANSEHCAHQWERARTADLLVRPLFPWSEMEAYRPSRDELVRLTEWVRNQDNPSGGRCRTASGFGFTT